MYEKRGKSRTEHRPDVTPLYTLTEPLVINRHVAPKVGAMIGTFLRHHDRLACTDVTSVVLSTHNGSVTLKLTSDLLS
jgi:hypothetical protein